MGAINPGSVFYAKFYVGNADGTIDTEMEAIDGSEDFSEVMNDTINDVDEHGGEAYVYECKAIRKVVYGKPKVTTLKSK